MNNTRLKTEMAKHNFRNSRFLDLFAMVEAGHRDMDLVEALEIPIRVTVQIKPDFHAMGMARKQGLTFQIKTLKDRIKNSRFVTIEGV